AHAARLEGLDAPAELAEADPVDLIDAAGQLRRGFLLDRHRHHAPPRPPGGGGHEEGEPPVAGDQPERRSAHASSDTRWRMWRFRITPRRAPRMNSTSPSTSGCGDPSASSRATA